MILNILLAFINCLTVQAIHVTVYGDVYNDGVFFSRTFPWIVDNIGGDLIVDYYLLGSGRYSVPQMCALQQMRHNTFLQAQYLKCETEETSSNICLCKSGIDPDIYRACVLQNGSLASIASTHYNKLGIDAIPIVEISPTNTIFGVEDAWYLKKICTVFEVQPRGCVKPFHCNNSAVYAEERSGVASFVCPECSSPKQNIMTTIEVPTEHPYYYP